MGRPVGRAWKLPADLLEQRARQPLLAVCGCGYRLEGAAGEVLALMAEHRATMHGNTKRRKAA